MLNHWFEPVNQETLFSNQWFESKNQETGSLIHWFESVNQETEMLNHWFEPVNQETLFLNQWFESKNQETTFLVHWFERVNQETLFLLVVSIINQESVDSVLLCQSLFSKNLKQKNCSTYFLRVYFSTAKDKVGPFGVVIRRNEAESSVREKVSKWVTLSGPAIVKKSFITFPFRTFKFDAV